MKENKSGRLIALIIGLGILLCAASFIAGTYYEKSKINKDNSENTNTNTDDNNAITPTAAATTTPGQDNNVTPTEEPSSENDNGSITYSNTDYGFDFSLPASWKGYTIQTEDWQGTAVSGNNSGKVIEKGPKIIIRHPLWTNDNPRQDIPIMVFTTDQWSKVEKEKIAVSAAPIGPTKLGSNSKYVFALPARYNFAFLTGYEEVQKIIDNNPLKGNESFQ